MMLKVLLKQDPETEKLVQSNNLFRTVCKTKDIVCDAIIVSGSTGNLVSIEMVENLEMEANGYPMSYKVLGL